MDRVHPATLPGRTLVIVPTRRLVRHLQLRLTSRRPAWLGLEVLHFRALARRLLVSSPAPPPRIASARLLRALLGRVLAGLPENGWSRFVLHRPGALGTLLSALRDLRESGVTPEELEAACDSSAERDLAAVHRAFVGELNLRRERGWVDDAGLIAAAMPLAEPFAARYGTVLVHGIYEMIGVHLELLRALERGAPVTVLAPFDESGRATAYAREFARRFLVGEGGAIEAIVPSDADNRGDMLTALYDETCSPQPSDTISFGFHHTQGAAAEAQVAIRLALQAVREGCPADEIVIAARGLAPLVPGLEAAFAPLDETKDGGEEPIPWDTSVAAPLRRQPLARDLLLLLKTAAEGFPRRAAAQLLRSPRIHWDKVGQPLPRTVGERADVWSRQAGLIGGLDEWTGDLVDWAARPDYRQDATEEERAAAEARAARRAGAARQMGQALRVLRDAVEPGRPRTWTEHAQRVEGFLAWVQPGEDEESDDSALRALEGLLDEMRGLVVLAGDERAVPLDEMVGWLEEAVDETMLPLRAGDGAGIRVLDVMQLRGLTCRRLFLLGMNSGLFPRVPPPDPVLGDALRRRVRRQSRRPLTVRDDAVSEERQLLSLTLGAATERIDVSWQRADETGKSRTPSLALRELARVATGRPDTEALLGEECHWPSHPLHWLQALEQRAGLLAPAEGLLLAALRSDGPDSVDPSGRFPELGAGLRMLQATERFAPGDATFDGDVAAAAIPERFSVTALETLGACPLRYFFRRILRVEELEQEADPLEVSPREAGLELHGVLERLYGGLAADGLFEKTSVETLTRHALERLEAAWDETISGPIGRLSRRLPLLGEQAVERWKEALVAFMREDLRRIVEEETRPVAFEERQESEIELAADRSFALVGRFDRRLVGTAGELIGDYKSSGKLADRGDITRMLKGRTLQVPLYWIMAGARGGVELLGIGPGYEAGERLVRFDGFETTDQHDGFLETVSVLLDLIRQGRYPLNKDDHYCSHCPYDQACRRTHPPTLEREKNSRDAGNYRLLAKKNKTSKPRLDDILPTAADGDGEAG